MIFYLLQDGCILSLCQRSMEPDKGSFVDHCPLTGHAGWSGGLYPQGPVAVRCRWNKPFKAQVCTQVYTTYLHGPLGLDLSIPHINGHVRTQPELGVLGCSGDLASRPMLGSWGLVKGVWYYVDILIQQSIQVEVRGCCQDGCQA